MGCSIPIQPSRVPPPDLIESRAHVSAQKSDFAMCMGAQDSKPRACLNQFSSTDNHSLNDFN
ncbi:hypothetical protein NC652_029174 [Populus alba x Populus x berolinensis]|uniref:Uncharacterized protein n=1 Tax=Populus alba x Populus x berolinensis TaxID=444605 RepID=A0AAD6M0T0_9ROSI|nr:hypothetical protein NC652_029174 [Populus alba x Populus x berolinensis]KAJ6976834.1 hypothetical protein NC653_028874 [Populus alba x Populus x berolinensis]